MVSDVALRLNATLDLQTLMAHFLNAVNALTNTEESFVLLPDKKRDFLQVSGYRGAYGVALEDLHFSIFHTAPGKVLRSGEPMMHTEDPRILNISYNQRVKSLIYIPITTAQQSVGVLGVWNRTREHVFSERDMDLLMQLANHAGVAIENVRLYEESQERSFELALIIDSTEAVNSSLLLPHVLSLISKSMLKAMQANWCEILLADEERIQLQTLSLLRDATWSSDEGSIINLDSVPKLLDALTHQTWVTLDRYDVGAEAILIDAYSVICVPVFAPSGYPYGVLSMHYLEAPPHQLDQDFIESMARELVQCLRENETNRALNFARQINTESLAQWSCFWTWDGHAEQLQLQLSQGHAVWLDNPYPVRTVERFPTFEQVMKRQTIFSYAISDSYIPEDIKQVIVEAQIRVLLIVPLVIQHSNMGLVVIADTQRDQRFESREINLAHALVLQAANALKNAQLYEDLQRSLEELRLTQAKLVQTARLSAIGELSAAVAHQINNPLTTVLGDSALMLSDIDESDRNWESLQAVHRAGQRAHEVVERLLGMARQKSLDDTPELLDINETIGNTMTLVEGTLYQSRIDLTIDLEPNLPHAYGIPGQLEDVWMNLMLNARDAMTNTVDPAFQIQSRHVPDRREVQVCMWDNGPGIEPDKVHHIFEAFFTTKPTGKGTGLGLHICKNIVERCGGKIIIDLEYTEGAKFIISLPY